MEDLKFKYMMLSRLKMDCDYYLNYGNKSERCLWADTKEEQIEEMKKLHNFFPAHKKPQWLTFEEILNYEKQMK